MDFQSKTMSQPTPNTPDMVMTKLIQLTATMSEVLNDFSQLSDSKTPQHNQRFFNNWSNNLQNIKNHYTEFQDNSEFSRDLYLAYNSSQLPIAYPESWVSNERALFLQDANWLQQPPSNNGTPFQLPVAAFLPQSNGLIQSPLVSKVTEFETEYVSDNSRRSIGIPTPNLGEVKQEEYQDQNLVGLNIMSQSSSRSSVDDTFSVHSTTSMSSPPPELICCHHTVTSPSRSKSKRRNRSSLTKPCDVCHKVISRDMSRHLRTHNKEPRFRCVFPHFYCRHKSGQFNRPYDFKKHLLNYHFKFDDPDIRKMLNLTDKLNHIGTCSCGSKFTAKEWLRDHILTNVKADQCPYLEKNITDMPVLDS